MASHFLPRAGTSMSLKTCSSRSIWPSVSWRCVSSAVLQLLVARLLDHGRQGFEDVLFGVVDVLEGFDEQVFHRLDGHGVSPA